MDVSIVVAAWNAEATIARAIDSALAQTGVSVEVIVVDDASTDATASAVEALARDEARLRLLRQPENAGPAAARNRAIDAARGRFVAPLDADDYMEPGRIAHLLEIAGADDWDMVGDDMFKVSEDDPYGPRLRLWTDQQIGLQRIDLDTFIAGNLSEHFGGRGELGFLKPLIARDFLTRHGLRYREDMRLGEDYALYAGALLAGARFCLTDPAGYIAVVRPDSLSGSHGAKDLGALVQSIRHLQAAPELTANQKQLLESHRIETIRRWKWLALIEAVRKKSPGAVLAAFHAPPSVVVYLLGNLGEQVMIRGRRKLGLAGNQENSQ